MDGDDRRRQQYGPPYQLPNSTRSNTGQSMPPPSTERFAQPGQSPSRADTSRSSIGRPFVSGYPGGYGYPEQQYSTPTMQGSSMQGVEMQYAPAYVQDPSRQQQAQAQPSHQQYGTYAQNIMLPSGASQQMYDTVPQYQHRHAAAAEVLSTQFGVPQYLPSSEHASMAMPPPPSQFVASQPEQPAYASQLPVTRPSGAQSYPEASGEYSVTEQPEAAVSQETVAAQNALNEGIRNYQEQLKVTFECIRTGRLTEASEKVLELSRWLLGSIIPLDLHFDKPDEHLDRIDLWREFNIAWEALGQMQKDVTEEALRTRRQPQDILTADTLRKMVDELVAMCDQIEQYGLVDYDLGVWEEQIVHIFVQCLDLLSPDDHAGQPSSSSSRP